MSKAICTKVMRVGRAMPYSVGPAVIPARTVSGSERRTTERMTGREVTRPPHGEE